MIKSKIYNAGFEGLFLTRPGVCPSCNLAPNEESETVKTEFLRDHKYRMARSLGDPVQFLQLNSPIREGGGASDSGVRLAVVIGGFHLEDVGDDAVDLHVTNEPCEEQLLGDGGAYQPEGRQTHQQLGEPEKRGHGTQTCAVEHSFLMC